MQALGELRTLCYYLGDMDVSDEEFLIRKEKVKALYSTQSSIHCPYFGKHVTLNSDGFHHLQFSARRERGKKEQLTKFNLLPLALYVIRKAGTVQEYRHCLIEMGKKSSRGEVSMKNAQFWGFDALTGENKIKIRAVLRQVGDGNITFWSVMPLNKLKKGAQRKLFTNGIEDN